MQKYIFIYSSSGVMAPQTPEATKQMLDAWKKWYDSLGDKLVDGGFAFKQGARIISGTMESASSAGLTGYTVVQAASYAEAMEMAKTNPMLMDPSTGVHVFEELPMGM